jgi:hypothetical protein
VQALFFSLQKSQITQPLTWKAARVIISRMWLSG